MGRQENALLSLSQFGGQQQVFGFAFPKLSSYNMTDHSQCGSK